MAIEVTSGAVVYRKKDGQLEYLLLESQNKGHFWGFPKGHVEGNESLKQTAEREIKEETQLTLPIDTSFYVYTEYDLPNGNHKQMTLYTADLTANEDIHLQAEEIRNCGWFNYQDARKQLTYDNLKQLLDQVNDHLTKQDD
ncbi:MULTISPECIES: bis(5'-nucleosyl)-tetraphosphatase [Limosilactobacillus]|uniref:Bis(5'-nucleosyl)-tetraphosphatase [asymmetrical] n=1 Tax=Limosilactobacillus panis DSM 6035 TaxID=1423782 RepID=A0A0R1XFV3_9LACO|nr:NUDIX domain-containing protein [Limosilactobacillus panis]KRM26326.1 hydrolase, nudix family [Limosilactobacillus panis DSM 6035]QZN92820.1 NUDIX domain-containing protein [Limosilactobacillus panis]